MATQKIKPQDPLASALNQSLIAGLIDAHADINLETLQDTARVSEVISAAAQMEMLGDLAELLTRWVDNKTLQRTQNPPCKVRRPHK